VRDGLSLLDQLIAFGGGRVGEAETRAMLGTVSRDHVIALAERLGQLDAAELMRCARELEQWAPDHAQLLDELAGLLTRVALRQAVPDLADDEIYPAEIVQRLASALSPEDVQLFYQIAILGRRDLPLAPDPRTGFEMTLLRMTAFRPSGGADETQPRRAPRPVREATRADAGVAAPPAAAPAGGPAAVRGEGTDGSWAAIVTQLELQGAARQLANHCSLIGRQGGLVRLALDPRHQLVRTRALEDKLAQALSRFYGEPVRIEIAIAEERSETPAEAELRASRAQREAAREVLEQDGTVRALKERFGATVLPDTVRPLK
jgi:DNA polymerase-3 subunit gamma/tau